MGSTAGHKELDTTEHARMPAHLHTHRQPERVCLLQMIATATVLDLGQNFSHFSHGFQEIQKAKKNHFVCSHTAWQARS